jgi:hypothetical protein
MSRPPLRRDVARCDRVHRPPDRGPPRPPAVGHHHPVGHRRSRPRQARSARAELPGRPGDRGRGRDGPGLAPGARAGHRRARHHRGALRPPRRARGRGVRRGGDRVLRHHRRAGVRAARSATGSTSRPRRRDPAGELLRVRLGAPRPRGPVHRRSSSRTTHRPPSAATSTRPAPSRAGRPLPRSTRSRAAPASPVAGGRRRSGRSPASGRPSTGSVSSTRGGCRCRPSTRRSCCARPGSCPATASGSGTATSPRSVRSRSSPRGSRGSVGWPRWRRSRSRARCSSGSCPTRARVPPRSGAPAAGSG